MLSYTAANECCAKDRLKDHLGMFLAGGMGLVLTAALWQVESVKISSVT